MSRTKNGSKPPGWEYRGKRPLSGYSPSKKNKVITHQIERARGKKTLREEAKEE